ncbi:MAG: Gfo/Idh/MocA family oxidoreductase [Deltaproteobacteria bacterium]|nr:Gfo/Idh/MocA family oxidoreductase [Deltaproteobacteria bacterium]NIS78187.1 Gfo/Idh/MocA family oxidoreductase [Deltaproteobacteria bacterium]
MIRVGVIGTGHLGTFHAQKYAELDGVELAGVCDIDEKKGIAVARDAGVAFFRDYRKLARIVDALSIAVPTARHYEISRFCLGLGKHILVEKPITEKVWQAERLIELAEKRNVILQVGHLERFNPALKKISRYVKKPGFIEAERISPFTDRSTDIDVVLDLMIHDIDLILYFVNSTIVRVNAIGVPVMSDKVDIANARVLFKTGCVANITASRVSMNRARKIRIFQEDGYFSIDFINRNIKVVRMIPSPDGTGRELTGELLETEQGDPLLEEIGEYISSVRSGKRPRVSGYEGLEALKAAYKIIDKI